MRTYINQYKLLFYLSWVCIYFIHPTWALPISITARYFVFSDLIIYFLISACVMSHWLKGFPVNEPLFVYHKDFSKNIKSHIWLLIVCCIAMLLHIQPISSPVYLVGDEALYLQGGLWIYDYFGRFWYRIVQCAFLTVTGLLLIISIRKGVAGNSGTTLTSIRTNKLKTSFFIFLAVCFLSTYFMLLRNLPHDVLMVAYPPLYKFIYLIPYFTLGINHIGPRIVQLIFCILSAVYLYRTINLFSDKETALLGASIYLFTPIVFDYAHFAELHSGFLFFIILISYYFLRFMIYQDNRGLLLSSGFIGIGFLYRRDIYLMFFICFAYLFLHKLKDRELHQRIYFKVLLLSLIPIIPWLIIGKLFYWRGAWISLSRFTSMKTVMAYFFMISEISSWIILLLFVLSAIYVLVARRNHVSLFWGFIFIAFYFLYTSQYFGVDPRFAMAFYPTIAIFLACFLRSISHKIRWEHSFKVIYLVLTIYLIVLCAVPEIRSRMISYKDKKAQYFPNEKAMTWVRDNVKNGEKMLSLHFKADLFYRDKYDINSDRIVSFWYDLQEYFPTPEKLKGFCRENKVSYIVFPDGPSFLVGAGDKLIFKYVKEDDEFKEVTKFNLDENYIYIYKIKES